MKSQGIFSQQNEGSPHLLQLNAVNALICLLWRLKVLGLVRQENKRCNFHQQSQDVLTQNLHQNQWKCYIQTAFPLAVFIWDLFVLHSLPTVVRSWQSLCNRKRRPE